MIERLRCKVGPKEIGDQCVGTFTCDVRTAGRRTQPTFAELEEALQSLTDYASSQMYGQPVILLGLVNTWIEDHIHMLAKFATKPKGIDQTMKVFGGARGERHLELPEDE